MFGMVGSLSPDARPSALTPSSQNIKQRGIQVLGSQDDFNRCAHFWRRTLEVLHDAHAGPTPADEPARDVGDNAGNDEDHIVGRYVYVTAPLWGRCKLFYEQSGAGKQDVLFLHTAGSDSRQYHGVLNDARMRERCHMVAFDLPGHGRSFPSNAHAAGAHTTTEEAYVGCIAAVIKALKLNKPIVCGASMAGQVCLAVAIQAEKVGAGGTIPLQGCDYLDMERTWHDKSPYANQALFNPEWIYGMMAPTAPLVNRQLIWHMYSGQAYGIFHGDLDFYFSGKNGWDGRARMKDIDTKVWCFCVTRAGSFVLTGCGEMSGIYADGRIWYVRSDEIRASDAYQHRCRLEQHACHVAGDGREDFW